MGILVVVSPPSVRSVKATCASSCSAGWQQVKIKRKRSSAKSMGSFSSAKSAGRLKAVVSYPKAACFSCLVRARRLSSIQLTLRGCCDPSSRVLRNTFFGPRRESYRKRFLQRLFRPVKRARHANQGSLGFAQILLEKSLLPQSGHSSLAVQTRGPLRQIGHWPNFNTALPPFARRRNSLRPFNGLVQILALQNVEAGELLLWFPQKDRQWRSLYRRSIAQKLQ